MCAFVCVCMHVCVYIHSKQTDKQLKRRHKGEKEEGRKKKHS